MDTSLVLPLVSLLQSFSSESLSIFLLVLGCVSIILMLRAFGLHGLYVYNTIAIIAANIQVLKFAQFYWIEAPLALGTVAFATTYLVSDIITEFYGKIAAQKGVWLCFSAQILLTLLMIMTLGYQPVGTDIAHDAMMVLFMPSVRLFVASLVAFAASQLLDIWVFQGLRELTQGRWLWIRTAGSFLVSALVDNILFSVLAWNLLSATPVGFEELWTRYILGTYLARILVAFASLPTIYYCRYMRGTSRGIQGAA